MGVARLLINSRNLSVVGIAGIVAWAAPSLLCAPERGPLDALPEPFSRSRTQ